MASNSVITSSEALRVLRNDLSQLSDTLHNICQEMEKDMSQLGGTWRDRKYQEFVQGYQPQIKKCENIAVHYKQWCVKNLDPAIEQSVALEEANVSGERFSFGSAFVGGVATGAAVTGAAVAGMVGSNDIGVGASKNDSGNGTTPLNSDEEQESLRRPVEELTESELLEEMSPWQREIYLKQKKELTDKYEYELFKAEDISKMSHEMQMDGANLAGAPHAIRAENIRENAEKEYQEGMQRLDNAARKGVQNNRKNEVSPEQMVSGAGTTGAIGGKMAATTGFTGFVESNVRAKQGSMPTTNMDTNMKTPSVDDYKAKFKEKGIFYIDENGDVNTVNSRVKSAINDVHGNNPKVTYENLEENLNGRQQGNRIILNKTLANDPREHAGTYAHENQHIDQGEHCSIRENQGNPLCENLKDYKEPCNDKEEKESDPEICEVKFNDYFWQDVEVNAREAEANAEIAYDEVLDEFKREHKLEKPQRWKIK